MSFMFVRSLDFFSFFLFIVYFIIYSARLRTVNISHGILLLACVCVCATATAPERQMKQSTLHTCIVHCATTVIASNRFFFLKYNFYRILLFRFHISVDQRPVCGM